MTQLQKYMKKLTEEMELASNLESESTPGSFFFPLDENTDVILSEDEKGMHLDCVIGPCPQKNEETFFCHALHGNLYGQGTLGAVLGIDHTGKQLTLSQDLDDFIPFDDFKDKLEDFLNTVESWRDEAAASES